MLHHFDAAPNPGINFDSAPAPALLYEHKIRRFFKTHCTVKNVIKQM
jgi:hypothetical protein